MAAKGKNFRFLFGTTFLFVSQSVIFGLAATPAFLFWAFIQVETRGFPLFDPYGRLLIVATSLIPAYLIFACALMFGSAGFNRLMRWRTEEGDFVVHDYPWAVVRWGSYNASISIVRIFCGEAMRATPLWTYYLKANGAKIGPGVYVNTARLNDHNLIRLEEKSVVGGDAKLVAHLVERGRLKTRPVILRKRAVVGINAVIGPGVEIGENSAVGAMSFVPKDTIIPPNQAWGGVPAKLIKVYPEGEFEKKGQPGIPITY